MISNPPTLNMQPVNGTSPLNDFVIGSAAQLVSRLLEAEVEEFLSKHSQLADDTGKPRMVRNGYLPERKLKTALGRVPVKIPRVRDRLKTAGSDKIRFNSKIIVPYQRRTNSGGQLTQQFLTELSKGDLVEAAAILLGPKRQFVTPTIANKLKEGRPMPALGGQPSRQKHFSRVWVDRISGDANSALHKSPLIVAIGGNRLG